MTNQKMLEYAYKVAANLSESEQKVIEKLSKGSAKYEGGSIPLVLSQLIYELKEDINRDEAKKTGKGAALKTAKDILKNGNKKRDILGYAQIIDGKQYLCDGYIAVELNEPLPLPEIPEGMNALDIKKLINYPAYSEIAELPDKIKLKSYIKVEKAKNKANGQTNNICYDFGENKPLVNAEYLLQIMELMPNATIYIENCYKPIYFESEAGRAVLGPIRPKDGTPREKTEI